MNVGAAPRCDWGRGTHASAAPEVPSPSVLAWTRRQARRPLRRFFAQHPNGCSGIAHLLILSALAAPQSGAAPLECPAPHHWGALLPYGFCMEREGYFPLSSVGHCRWGPSLLRVGVGAYLSSCPETVVATSSRGSKSSLSPTKKTLVPHASRSLWRRARKVAGRGRSRIGRLQRNLCWWSRRGALEMMRHGSHGGGGRSKAKKCEVRDAQLRTGCASRPLRRRT